MVRRKFEKKISLEIDMSSVIAILAIAAIVVIGALVFFL